MKYTTVIFDMDGTTLNTLTDLTNALNFALNAHGFPKRTPDEVRRFAGNGIVRTIELGLSENATPVNISKVHETFTEYYSVHCDDNTRPYPGVPQVMKELRAAGFKTAIVSNKADYAVQTLCEEHFPGLTDAAVGHINGVRSKPAPDMVQNIMKKLNSTPEETVYIGDSEVDIQTALNSGIDCITVSWGFRDVDFLLENGAKTIVADTEELFGVLTGE